VNDDLAQRAVGLDEQSIHQLTFAPLPVDAGTQSISCLCPGATDLAKSFGGRTSGLRPHQCPLCGVRRSKERVHGVPAGKREDHDVRERLADRPHVRKLLFDIYHDGVIRLSDFEIVA